MGRWAMGCSSRPPACGVVLVSVIVFAAGLDCGGRVDARNPSDDENAGPSGGNLLDAAPAHASDGQVYVPPVIETRLPDSVSVVITEIMYHPAYEQADHDNHEFIEIYNRSKAPVMLERWKLSGGTNGIAFTF